MRIIATGAFVLCALMSVSDVRAQARSGNDWSGAYVGTHVGYGATRLIATNSTPNSAFFGNYWTSRNGQFFDLNGSGGLGGLQFGYQQAYKDFVFGAEAFGGFARMTTTKTSPYFPASDREASRFGNRFGALAKLGVPAGDFMPYLKFGYVNTEFRFRARDSVNNVAFTSKSRLNGFQAGAGLDYAVTRNVHLGLEYSGSFFSPKDRYGLTRVGGINFSEHYRFKASQHIISLRANYLFGGL